MLRTAPTEVQQDFLNAQIDQLLDKLGQGRVDSVAYDTAWVARLAPMYPNMGFDGALGWLEQNQHADGSWGGEIVYSHDRFICTLAAAVALRSLGRGEAAIKRAEKYLWREYTRLLHDPIETIGFPVLTVSLVEEARLLGIDIPTNPYCDADTIERKLQILRER